MSIWWIVTLHPWMLMLLQGSVWLRTVFLWHSMKWCKMISDLFTNSQRSLLFFTLPLAPVLPLPLSLSLFPWLPPVYSCPRPPQVIEVALVFGAPFGWLRMKCKPAKTNCITSYRHEGRNCVPIICLWFANEGLNAFLPLRFQEELQAK